MSFHESSGNGKMVRIALLADHPGEIPTLARWFRSEWPDYYTGVGAPAPEREFANELHRDRLPLRLVAYESGQLVGTIVLRERALEGFPEYQPGLGGLYVSEDRRGRGIGAELVRAGSAVARSLGYERIYTSTDVAGGILARLGWERMHSVDHGSQRVTFYRLDLEKASPSAGFPRVQLREQE